MQPSVSVSPNEAIRSFPVPQVSWTECWVMRYTVPQRFATSCKCAQHNGSGAAKSINAK